jgi:hypothetical protein
MPLTSPRRRACDARGRAAAEPHRAGPREWLRAGGWHVVGGGDRGGMVAHRGILHPDEYVDTERIEAALEHELGFKVDELRWVYRDRGRRKAAQLALRDRVDARLLELRRTGGNLELLARLTAVDRKAIGRALARARVAGGGATLRAD